MTGVRQFREPRSQVVFRHTARCIRNSGHTDKSFAGLIAESYMRMVAPAERVVQFHVGTDLDSIERAQARNAKLIERFINGTVKLPADLEEAWVLALPLPWRDECERELASRYGFLGVREPATHLPAELLSVAGVLAEVAHVMEAVAHVTADGCVTAADAPALQRLMSEAREAQAELATLRETARRDLEAIGAGGGSS